MFFLTTVTLLTHLSLCDTHTHTREPPKLLPILFPFAHVRSVHLHIPYSGLLALNFISGPPLASTL
jgi:hypothetical protein